MSEQCTWTPDSDGTWETSCGQAFVLIDGTPRDNGMNYCTYCGKPLRDDIRPTEKEQAGG